MSVEELERRVVELEVDRNRWREMAERLLRLLPEGAVFYSPYPPGSFPSSLPAGPFPSPPFVAPPSIAPPLLWPPDVVITCEEPTCR